MHQAAVTGQAKAFHKSAASASTLAVDMMDNASALPTCRSDNINSRQLIENGLNSPTRLHEEAFFEKRNRTVKLFFDIGRHELVAQIL